MKIFPKAIIYGLLVSLVIAILSSIIIGLAFGTETDNQKVNISALIVDICAGVIGGFVTSHKSPSSKLMNAFLLGVIGVVIALFLNLFVAYPSWFNLISIAVTIPVALLGSYIEILKVEKH